MLVSKRQVRGTRGGLSDNVTPGELSSIVTMRFVPWVSPGDWKHIKDEVNQNHRASQSAARKAGPERTDVSDFRDLVAVTTPQWHDDSAGAVNPRILLKRILVMSSTFRQWASTRIKIEHHAFQ